VIYPLTVVRARYGGVYEGGKFAAFNAEPDGIRWHLPCAATDHGEPDAFGGDPDCMSWWMFAHMVMLIGVGETIEEAILDLDRKIANSEEKDEREALDREV